MSFDLCVITPTGDRPEAFALCERWMARQTYRGRIQWLVLDNGRARTRCTMGQEYIRLKPDHEPGKRSLSSKIVTACDLVDAPLVAVIEDDDYYLPGHLADLAQRLAHVEVAGTTEQRYYNVAFRAWWHGRNVGSCLCSTGLRCELVPMLREAAKLAYATQQICVDRLFWRSVFERGRTHDDFDGPSHFVGMKGLPGRAGLGQGHDPHRLRWQADRSFDQLRAWVGDDADTYIAMSGPDRSMTMLVKAKERMYINGKVVEAGEVFEYQGLEPAPNMELVGPPPSGDPPPHVPLKQSPTAEPVEQSAELSSPLRRQRGRPRKQPARPTDGPVTEPGKATMRGRPRPEY